MLRFSALAVPMAFPFPSRPRASRFAADRRPTNRRRNDRTINAIINTRMYICTWIWLLEAPSCEPRRSAHAAAAAAARIS
eukprot:812322-Pyramimonas_sp.AAC.1